MFFRKINVIISNINTYFIHQLAKSRVKMAAKKPILWLRACLLISESIAEIVVFIVGKAVKLLLKAVLSNTRYNLGVNIKGIICPGKICFEPIGIDGTGNDYAIHNYWSRCKIL